MKLVIDARPLTRNASGIYRYLNSILDHLVERPSIEIILYADRSSGVLEKFAVNPNVTIRNSQSQCFHFLQWLFYSSYWLHDDQPDCYWSPRHDLPLIVPSNCYSVVTIHDMVWKTVPKTMPFLKYIKERMLMPLAIKKANTVIAVSDSTKNLISHYFPKHMQKVTLIKNVSFIDNSFMNHQPKANAKPFFLAVGTLEPRKNYVKLLEAFDEYIEQGGNTELVIVGRKGWKYKEIFNTFKLLNHQNRVVIKEEIDDTSLLYLYKTARGFISISLDEGFGLPAAEAQSYGLPMLLSDIPVYRELFSEMKCWADPLNKEQIISSLFELDSAPMNYNVNMNDSGNWQEVTDHTFEALTNFDC